MGDLSNGQCDQNWRILNTFGNFGSTYLVYDKNKNLLSQFLGF